MPKLYDGDTNPHLFTYFLGVESDHYECPDHGCECYNNVPVIRNGNLENCGAFLCSNPWICPGYRLTSWSQLGGQQVVLNLRFEYCSEARCDIWAGWWLRFANTWVGFYPKVLFNSSGLSDYAGRIQFGGEVMSYADGRITNTDMGSGILPSSECSYFFSCFGQVAYQRAIQYIDMSLNMQTPVLDDVRMDRPECYDIHKDYSYWLGRYIFFGGPGYSSTCL
jgi:hypothetical protein